MPLLGHPRPCISLDAAHNTFSTVTWQKIDRLDNIVKICSRITGKEQQSLCNIFNHHSEKNPKVIMSNRNHVLSMFHELLPSGRCYQCLKVIARAQKSFTPHSIRLLNSTS